MELIIYKSTHACIGPGPVLLGNGRTLGNEKITEIFQLWQYFVVAYPFANLTTPRKPKQMDVVEITRAIKKLGGCWESGSGVTRVKRLIEHYTKYEYDVTLGKIADWTLTFWANPGESAQLTKACIQFEHDEKPTHYDSAESLHKWLKI